MDALGKGLAGCNNRHGGFRNTGPQHFSDRFGVIMSSVPAFIRRCPLALFAGLQVVRCNLAAIYADIFHLNGLHILNEVVLGRIVERALWEAAQKQIDINETPLGQVKQVSKQANGGIATAMAMGGIAAPDTKPYGVWANLGAYRGEAALAGGLALRLTDNATLNSTLGVGATQGDVGGRVGVSFAW